VSDAVILCKKGGGMQNGEGGEGRVSEEIAMSGGRKGYNFFQHRARRKNGLAQGAKRGGLGGGEKSPNKKQPKES